MKFRLFLLAVLIASNAAISTGQETRVWNSQVRDFWLAREAFDEGLFGKAIHHYQRCIEDKAYQDLAEYGQIRKESELGIALASLRLDLPEARDLIVRFADGYAPDPLTIEASFVMADQFYRSRRYEEALAAYKHIPLGGLTRIQKNELQFKKGYAHFVLKEFSEARFALEEVRREKTQYYYPANYYHGMCMFFEGNYDAALESFREAEKSELYKEYIPHYLCRIYHAQGDYNRLIDYGEEILQREPQNAREIRHLVGQGYYELGNFTAALPYLRYYEEHSASMEAIDFYQLAYAEYHEGNYQEAIPHFREIFEEETAIGDMSKFYLGKCYLQLSDKHSARIAFGAAAKSGLNGQLQEEALMLFGQLSAELNFHPDAIRAFEQFSPGSAFYTRAQEELAGVFLNTRDYNNSIQLLEARSDLTPTLQEAYQKLCLYRGIQLYNDNVFHEAALYLVKALEYPTLRSIRAQSYFWQAEIAHKTSQFQKSIDLGNQFFTLARTGIALPPEASEALAHYTQGYNYLKTHQLHQAEQHFKQAVEGIQNTPAFRYGDGYTLQRVLPDAMLRTGDCLFKRNRYSEAIGFYQQVSKEKLFGYDYALYQEGMILGLQNKPVEKIVVLDELISGSPRSEFIDDALFQKSVTFMEMRRGEKAIGSLKELVNTYPHSEFYYAALLRLGLVSYNNGDLDAAISYYETILAGNPSQLEVRDALAALEEIYVRDLRKPDAYLVMLERMPGYDVSEMRKDSIRFRSAEIQYEEGNYQNAIAGFSDYLQHFPSGTHRLQALFNRAESNAQLKQFEEALKDYRTIIDDGTSRFRLAAMEKAAVISYHHSADFEKAFLYYDMLAGEASNATTRFDALLGALRSAYRMDDGDAVARYAGLLENDVRLTPETKAELHYYAGKQAFKNTQYDDALHHFNQLTKISNDAHAAEGRYLISRIYYIREQFDIAAQLCQNTTSESANYPFWVARSLILLSDIFVAQEDYFSARAPLEALLEHYSGDEAILEEARAKLNTISQLESQKSRIRQDTGKYLDLDYSKDR